MDISIVHFQYHHEFIHEFANEIEGIIQRHFEQWLKQVPICLLGFF